MSENHLIAIKLTLILSTLCLICNLLGCRNHNFVMVFRPQILRTIKLIAL